VSFRDSIGCSGSRGTVESLAEHGLVPVLETNKQGACQYSAVAHSVYGNVAQHARVRREVVVELRNHRDRYVDFVEVGGDGEPMWDPLVSASYDAFTDRMSRESEHGNNVTLVAASRLYKRPFKVIVTGAANVLVIATPGATGRTAALGYEPEESGVRAGHYLATNAALLAMPGGRGGAGARRRRNDARSRRRRGRRGSEDAPAAAAASWGGVGASLGSALQGGASSVEEWTVVRRGAASPRCLVADEGQGSRWATGGHFDALAEEVPADAAGRRVVRFAPDPVSAVFLVPPHGTGGRRGPWAALGRARKARARLVGISLRRYARAEAAAEVLQAFARGVATRHRLGARRVRTQQRQQPVVVDAERSGSNACPRVLRRAPPTQVRPRRERRAPGRVRARQRPGDEARPPRPLPLPLGRRRQRTESTASRRPTTSVSPRARHAAVRAAIEKVEVDERAAAWRARTDGSPAGNAGVGERRASALLFWSHRAGRVGACLSNWSPCSFVLGGESFSSSEQALMLGKAKLFGSESSAARIRAVQPSVPGAASDAHGKRVQELGRLVEGFDQDVWDARSEGIATKVLLAKFSQSPALRQYLLGTGSRWLVECSPLDPVWGIGADAEAAAALSDTEFEQRCAAGNRLGRVLMGVRALLRAAAREETLLEERAKTLAESGRGGLREDGVEGGSQRSQERGSSARCAAGGGSNYEDVERRAALALERRAQRKGLGTAEAGQAGSVGSAELAVPAGLQWQSLFMNVGGADASEAAARQWRASFGAVQVDATGVSGSGVAAVYAKVVADVELVAALLATGRARLVSGDGRAYAAVLESVRQRLRRESVEACDDVELARRNAVKESNLLPGAPRGLPACFVIDHELLVADARELLARGEFDDAAHVAELAAFSRTGGFRAFGLPLERDVYGDGTSDDPSRVNAPMDLSMLKTLYMTLRDELAKGWLTRYANRAAVPYRAIRVQPMFFVPKGDGEGGQASKMQVDPADGAERNMLRWRLCEDAKRSGLNATSSMAFDLSRGSPGQLDDARDAGDLIMGLKRGGHDVEMSLTDLSGAYRQWPVCDLDRPSFALYGIDVSKPFPSVDDLDIDAEGIVHLRPDQCCMYVSNVLRFGWHKSVSHFWRSARLLKALHLSEGTPVETFVPRDVHEMATFLDDNLSIAIAGWGERAKKRLHQVFARYGVAISLEKDVRDGKVEFEKQFLGIVLDAVKSEMRISAVRLDKVLAKLEDVKERSFMLRSEFASLVGLLSFCASCAPASRVFMRRMFAALRRSHGRFLRLDRGLKADVSFWLRFAPTQNGKSLMLEKEWIEAEELRFWSDASGGANGGYGAAFQLPSGDWEYFGGLWREFGVDTSEMHISQLEMLAAAMAFDTWGEHLSRKRVVTRCDNESSVYTINSLSGGGGATTDAGMLVVAREIYFICAKHSFMTRSKWIGTKLNVLADAASRADWRRFFEYAKSEFGVDRSAMREVVPTLDTAAMLTKMRKAILTERRMDEEAARARGRGRAPPSRR